MWINMMHPLLPILLHINHFPMKTENRKLVTKSGRRPWTAWPCFTQVEILQMTNAACGITKELPGSPLMAARLTFASCILSGHSMSTPSKPLFASVAFYSFQLWKRPRTTSKRSIPRWGIWSASTAVESLKHRIRFTSTFCGTFDRTLNQ